MGCIASCAFRPLYPDGVSVELVARESSKLSIFNAKRPQQIEIAMDAAV